MLRRCLIYGIIFTLLNTPVLVSAQEAIDLGQVVITATKTEEELKKVSSSVTVITREDIENKKVATTAELLREVPGLDVARSGGPGKMTSIYLRGGNSGHVLVLIDGIQVNSPTTGNFDFSNLTTDNIERIEIVRGPQSTLYGSDAMGGVINIITRKGKGKSKVSLTAGGGSFDTSRGAVSLTFADKKVDFSLTASRLETEGISAATAQNGDNDDYTNTTVAMKFGVKLSPTTLLNTTLRRTDARSELDARAFLDDPNFVQNTQQTLLGVNLTQQIGDWCEQRLKFQMMKNKLEGADPDTVLNNYRIDTDVRQGEWQQNFFLFDKADTLTMGVEYEQQSADSRGNFNEGIRNRAVYIQNQAALLDETLFLTAGARVDKHSLFGSWDTYKLGMSYLFKTTDTRFKANYGSGFKAPTLNDLYWPTTAWSRGNSNLKPEENWGYDFGLEQRFWRLFFGATYFHNTYDNLIQWVEYAPWSYEPQNVAEATTEGIELEMGINPCDKVELKLNYTQTRAKNKVTDKELARRPEHKANMSLDIRPTDQANINLTLNYVGKRWDNTANTRDIAAYFKLDVAAYYDLTEHVQIFARADNLLDEKYEEIRGYNTLGPAFYSGVKLTF